MCVGKGHSVEECMVVTLGEFNFSICSVYFV